LNTAGLDNGDGTYVCPECTAHFLPQIGEQPGDVCPLCADVIFCDACDACGAEGADHYAVDAFGQSALLCDECNPGGGDE
jgi:DNA-directed RNA polymerase subunit RPC12/RpoP